MKRKPQLITQIFFLSLFLFLLIVGKIQVWMGVFILGTAASLLFGRFYCSWICPINTSMKGISKVKKNLKIKSLKIPAFLSGSWTRALALMAFAVVFSFILVSGNQLPVLPFLFFSGILLTLFYPEEFWHNYLCPYGTILKFTSSHSRTFLKIGENTCTNCNACIKACPVNAIAGSADKPQINKSDCILCMKCTDVCRENSITLK